MPINILMPALSPTMEKGNLAKWLKKEGDTVKTGDVIAEIETDKATMEYEAVDDGTLAKIVVPEGTHDVAVNQLIAVLAQEGEDVKAAAAAAGAVAAAPTVAKPPPAPSLAPSGNGKAQPAGTTTRLGMHAAPPMQGAPIAAREGANRVFIIAAGAALGERGRHRYRPHPRHRPAWSRDRARRRDREGRRYARARHGTRRRPGTDHCAIDVGSADPRALQGG